VVHLIDPPDGPVDIGYYRYEGYSLEEKIAWTQQDAGKETLSEAQLALNDLGEDLIASDIALRLRVSELGGSWEGMAAAAAGRAMMTAASWSSSSVPAATLACVQMGLQAESVHRTKYGMPPSAPQPTYGFGDVVEGAVTDTINTVTANIFDIQTNYDEQVALRQQAGEQANRLLYEHETASRANLHALPVLDPIPAMTVRIESSTGDHLSPTPGQVTAKPPTAGAAMNQRPNEHIAGQNQVFDRGSENQGHQQDTTLDAVEPYRGNGRIPSRADAVTAASYLEPAETSLGHPSLGSRSGPAGRPATEVATPGRTLATACADFQRGWRAARACRARGQSGTPPPAGSGQQGIRSARVSA